MKITRFIVASVLACGCGSNNVEPQREERFAAAADGGAVVEDAGMDAAVARESATRAPDVDAGSRPAKPNKPARGDRPAAEPPRSSGDDDDDDAGVTPSQPNFSISEPLEVAVQLAEADWEVLRFEGRELPATIGGCKDPAFQGYTKFSGQVEVLGETLQDVEVRKKGYLGSLSIYRPSLVLDFNDRYVGGYKRLTLNNNHEDRSNAHQCLAYELYGRAGLRVPQCGLAVVTVNGMRKGYYTNVEPIKKPFLRRVFGEDDGNLYELQAPTDLVAAQIDKIELKNDDVTDRSDLTRLVEALTVPDAELIDALEPLLDLDEFLTLWALEALVGQWDGLSAHGTNMYLYHARSDDRFHPIPWGLDVAFTSARELFSDNGTVSVFVGIQLSNRLWALPEWRTKYQERLRKLLNEVWNPDELIEQLRAIATLTEADEHAVATTEKFIREQRQLLEEELDLAEPPAPRSFGIPGTCVSPRPASGGLYGVWDGTPRSTSNVLDQLALLLSARRVPADMPVPELQLHERVIEPARNSVLGAAGLSAQGSAYLGLSFTDAVTNNIMLIALALPRESLHTGEIAFHGFETFGLLSELRPDGTPRLLGYIGGGTIKLDMVGTETGDVVRGSFSAELAGHLE